MIVLVGNGTSAIGKRLGERIDAAARVVRFNHFRLEGYDTDLGTKVTDHVHTQGVRRPWPGARSWVISAPHRYVRLALDPDIDKRNIVPLDLLEAIIVEASLGDKCHASCGLVGIFLALKWGGEVAITNFDFATSGHYWDKSHRHSQNHNWTAEARYVQSLIVTGRLALLR